MIGLDEVLVQRGAGAIGPMAFVSATVPACRSSTTPPAATTFRRPASDPQLAHL